MGALTGHPVYTKDNFFLSLAADWKQTVLIIPITYKSRNTFFSSYTRRFLFTITLRLVLFIPYLYRFWRQEIEINYCKAVCIYQKGRILWSGSRIKLFYSRFRQMFRFHYICWWFRWCDWHTRFAVIYLIVCNELKN